MATFLFDKTVFGPVQSRRLGISLGINLLPDNSKLCSFDCIYCECGWNPDPRKIKAVLPTRKKVKQMLEAKLYEMSEQKKLPDVITFAGNGEPTMHPKFPEIIDDTIDLRNKLAPKARIAVLSNSTMLFKENVVGALKKVDDNILKLDSVFTETIKIMNQPVTSIKLERLFEQLKAFNGKLIIQTMFLRGTFNGKSFDNTSKSEVDAWIERIKDIAPKKIMIYTIARDTPINTLEKISIDELNQIAHRVKTQTGIEVEVSG
jgi:wyosine [tRNA(Phe)-imidazoG37] synthetase (radical SAM superfamily)